MPRWSSKADEDFKKVEKVAADVKLVAVNVKKAASLPRMLRRP